VKLQQSTLLGLYAVLELAKAEGEQLSAADIADKFDVSINHLAKVLRTLVRARLLRAARGAGGGYRFIGNAKRTTLMDVIELFEPVSIEGFEDRELIHGTDVEAGLAIALVEISEMMQATLQSITITTMLKIIERDGAARHAG
jgi:Rrf2 family nitric oxide-sensitive transcriptional repressor